MKNLIILTLLLFTAYSSKNLNYCVETKLETTGISIDDSEYTIHIDIETTTDGQQNLIIKMDLKNDSHFVSPNDPGNFSGQFYMDLGSYNDINFDSAIIETPKSKEGFVPDNLGFSKGNWVTTDTTYRQPIYVISDGDFQVFGRVNFVIEPRCTLEQIAFGIISKNGVLEVTQAKC
jgi:hypothetical protein